MSFQSHERKHSLLHSSSFLYILEYFDYTLFLLFFSFSCSTVLSASRMPGKNATMELYLQQKWDVYTAKGGVKPPYK
jgi:hypothetical protein